MSQEQRTTKNFFRLNKGLNTEANELNFPDGYTTDEANYELLVDGSRRRRKGLALEASGTAFACNTFRTAEFCQTYNWRNVGGDPNKNVVVFRKGDTLYFADEGENLSAGWETGTGSFVSLSGFYTDDATEALVSDEPVTMSHGKGHLIVGGQYLKPFYVSYDPATTYYSASIINIKCRDFSDVEDGYDMVTEPTGAITDAHRYNLRNRGWPQTKMDTYFSTHSKHPSKNMIWWRGWKRAVNATSNVADPDGLRSWDEAKLVAEGFGASTAPRGSMFLSPYDTTSGYGLGTGGTGIFDISTWVVADETAVTWEVTITTAAAHGLSSGNTFTIAGNEFEYLLVAPYGGGFYVTRSLDGTHTATTGTSGTTLNFSIAKNAVAPYWNSWGSQYLAYGQVDVGGALVRGTGADHGDGFRAVEFHDGRVFFSGMANEEWADTIFYSQLADTPSKFGRCYQDADPTDENFNALVATDGGTIVIPGMAAVQNMVKVRSSLVILTLEGVYEVSGGQRGFFTADGYSVRKISDVGCNSPTGICKIEDSLVFTGPAGIHILAPNQYTGQLEVTNAIENNIQTLWNEIPNAEQERAALFYDDALKRLYVLYGPDGSSTHYVDTALIFSAQIGAWFKYTFTNPANNGLLCGVALTTVDDPTDGKKAKFFYESDTVGFDDVSIADFNQTGYDDWHGANGPLPYMYTGWDNLGDFQRRKQAPVITVFSKRTETGYTSTGGGYAPDNESSTKMSVLWDWTDSKQWTSTARTAQEDYDATGKDTNPSISGKITDGQEVYRHVRTYTPSGTTDVDGYPVVVTRNKVRGRGRVLQLKFEGATDKDSHLLGFAVNYKVSRGK